jgi:hypothetical protein
MEVYTNPVSGYSVKIKQPWSVVRIPDPMADLFLICDVDACGQDARLSFGSIFDQKLKKSKIDDLIKEMNGVSITETIRSSPMVDSVTLLSEGFFKVGDNSGYEVVSRILAKNGKTRLRHTFIMIRAGYVYTVNLGVPPESYRMALNHAKVLLSFYTLP